MVGHMLVRPALRSLLRGAPCAALLLAITAITAGCGGSTPPSKRPERPKRVLKTPEPPPPAPKGPPLLPAHVVAQLEDEEAAPYTARRGDDMLLLYVAGGQWRTRILEADGAPRAEPLAVAPAAGDIPVASVRATATGYLAAWIENKGGNRALEVLALDPAGKAVGAPVRVLQSADEIAWLEVLPGPKSAAIVWEVPRENGVDVIASAIVGGKPSTPVTAARDVLGWQAIATERGAALAFVRRGKVERAEGDEQGPRLGQVALVEIDAAGKPAAPVVVSADPSAQVDVELALVDGRYLLAWTDERDIDASAFVAVVEPGGRVAVPPRQATSPAGEQALVSLVAAPFVPGGPAPGKRALLAWEDLLRSPQQARLIHLATIGADGALGKERAGLLLSANGPPDLAVAGDGFAALTLAPAGGEEAAAQGGDPPIWPTFVRFGPDLSVRAAEPVRAAPFASTGHVPYLVRGLSCDVSRAAPPASCTALASAAGAQGSGASPLAVVSLPARQSPWRAPAFREEPDALPRSTAVRALYSGDHIAEVTAADLGGGRALAAWVTYYLEGSDSAAKAKEQGATLAVRAVAVPQPAGASPDKPASPSGPGGPGGLGKLTVISQRASSFGGVALASTPGDKPESVLAWVAREKGESQLYATKIDAAGEKGAQKKVTVVPRRARPGLPNEPTDVAIAHDGQDGWITAWIDTRDGNAEVYVARLDKNLTKTVPDKRITDAPGDAAEVQILMRGKEVWLVWSDTRQGEDAADIYLSRLDARTLQKIGAETRLFASPEHSRTPALAPLGTGMLAAWIEEPPGEAAGGGVRVAQVDERGMLQGAPALVPVSGAAASMALACDKVCRAVMTVTEGDVVTLRALPIAPGGALGQLRTLGTLTGNSAQDVSPVLAGPAGTTLFFADDAVSGAGRVRWMNVAWP